MGVRKGSKMEKVFISSAEAEKMHKRMYMYFDCFYKKDFDCKDGFYTLFNYYGGNGTTFQVVKKDGFVESILKIRAGRDNTFYEVAE